MLNDVEDMEKFAILSVAQYECVSAQYGNVSAQYDQEKPQYDQGLIDIK
ncbi:hypothetical protein ACFOZY_07200 [Chungangia koreensis]|uniref:Uncharacterized protein n=1 Tax=Chungangia koreensis TaxID=752657 RepID=A0ABV8X4K9_9LACT